MYTRSNIFRPEEADHEKPLFWIGRSYDDLVACPPEVRRTFGFALGLAQQGGSMERTTGKRISVKTTVRQGGKNIFEDLKLPDAEELNAKAQIAYRICDLLQERKLTQKAAAELLGTDQPRVSALLRGKLEGFSSDRLFRFLNALDQDIEIVIRHAKKKSRHVPGIRVLIPA